MKKQYGIFVQILAAFAVFAAGLAIVMSITGYFAADKLSLALFEKRSGILLDVPIQAEKQARNNEDFTFEPAKLIDALDLRFLVGKQLPPELTALESGFHLSYCKQ